VSAFRFGAQAERCRGHRRGRADCAGQPVVQRVWVRSRDDRRTATYAVRVGHRDGDERGQGVHVLAGSAVDVDRVAVQQAIAVAYHA